MMSNRPEFVLAWFGIAKAGLVLVPVNTAFKAGLLAYVLEHSDAEVLIVEREFLGAVAAVLPGIPGVRACVVLGGIDGGIALPRPIRAMVWSELLEADDAEPDMRVGSGDPVAIFYTGGTTGRSKGVVWPQHYAVRSSIPVIDFGPDDVHYNCLPLYHGILPAVTLGPWLSGGGLALATRFSTSRFWSDIRRYGATHTLLVGSMFRFLHQAPALPDDADNPLRYVRGNPMPPDIHCDFERRFGCLLLESYSMTEAIPITANRPGLARVGSCGTPVPGAHEVRIVDEHDGPVSRGTVGEFVVRPTEPYTMMLGYHKMPGETLRAFRNLWFHTGDLGYEDEEGFYHHAGRSKDSIRRRGVGISAAEVEEVVNSHPAVRECAVIGVRDGPDDEEVKVVVEHREGEPLTPSALLDFCADKLPDFMVPRYVEVVGELPRTALGRVEKHHLRERGVTEATWDREVRGYATPASGRGREA
jgi:crotonobetaine/carnitine-CoA ligase